MHSILDSISLNAQTNSKLNTIHYRLPFYLAALFQCGYTVQCRLLRDQVLFNGTGKFFHLVPKMRSEPGIIYLQSRCWDQDQEWIWISPANETGTGPYLALGLSKVSGISH